MNTTLSDRQSRLRARAAELAERAARLPRALCAACGGVVAEGQGVAVSVSAWNRDAALWRRDDAERERTGAVPVRGWARRHDECATTAGIVRQLVGVDVAPEVAGLAVIEASRIRGAEILAEHRVGDPLAAPIQRRPRAWSHLTDADRERLAAVVARERGKVEPRRCVEGACAWCGVSTSIGWRSSPETWSDGSQAPLCRDCAVVWDRRSRPADKAARRACALEALSGAAGFGGDGLGILAFCDVAGDDHAGHPIGWTYAPAPLAELRERARMTWPNSLPGEIGGEYIQRAAEQRRAALADAARADRDAAAAKRIAAGWPV